MPSSMHSEPGGAFPAPADSVASQSAALTLAVSHASSHSILYSVY